jgi:SAM-dependent methyltransferase
MQLAAGVDSCTVFEVRSTEIDHPQVQVRVEDLTYAQDVHADFDLITCLSTIEHVGLGRYGDPLDPWGDVKLAGNLRRLLRPGGIMLLSFPVGIGAVVYNGHRIYSRRRREMLFGDLHVIDRRWGRSVLGQLRHRTEVAMRIPGASSQPVYVLQKAK